eukprot:s1001_g10.t1
MDEEHWQLPNIAVLIHLGVILVTLPGTLQIWRYATWDSGASCWPVKEIDFQGSFSQRTLVDRARASLVLPQAPSASGRGDDLFLIDLRCCKRPERFQRGVCFDGGGLAFIQGDLSEGWLLVCGRQGGGADTTLDLVSYELRLAWLRLQWDLRGPPWGYELASENSSIFIVKQVSPLYPSQEGLLVGASHFTEALIPGRLLHAVNSPSSIVAITAQAVLQRYGAWNSTELTRTIIGRDKDRSFHFSLRDAREGRWRECHPLAQTDATAEDPDHDWESNCYQATTHTIYLDDTLQLVVVSTPAAAFSKFHVDKAIQVELEVKREHHEAEGKQWDTLIESAFLGVLASAVVVIMGLVTSCWVLRPLRGLSKLMIRLTQLDFAHDSEEYRKLQDGEPSHIWEVDSLKDGFWRLSRSIEVFARFVPDSVVRRLITGDDKASRLHVLRKNVSIMFSDVRDFTSISEELKQDGSESQHREDDLIMLLTVYLTGMTRVIESYQGVVGEILGDGILAFWNTPDDVAQHAAKACSAALAQQQALIQLNEEFKKMGLPSLSIRIGIHTGEVLTGNIGCLSGKTLR